MIPNSNLIEPLVERVEAYGKTTIELLKLKAIEKTAVIPSLSVFKGIVLLLITIFVVFFNIALSLFIGEEFGKIYIGFLVVSGFYLLLAIIVYAFMHNYIKNYISNLIIKVLTKP